MDLVEFVVAVGHHWIAWLTGSVVAVVLFLIYTFTKWKPPKWLYLGVVVATLLISAFQAWDDEHAKATERDTRIRELETEKTAIRTESQGQNSQLAFTQHHLQVLSSRSAVYETIAAEHDKFKGLKVCEGRDKMEARRLRTNIDLLKNEFQALEAELAKIERRAPRDIEPDFIAAPCPPQNPIVR